MTHLKLSLRYPLPTGTAWAAQQGISPVFRPVNRIELRITPPVIAAESTPMLRRCRDGGKTYYMPLWRRAPLQIPA